MCPCSSSWWLAYLYPLVSINDIVDRLMLASESTQQGSVYNQVLIIGFAAMGLVHTSQGNAVSGLTPGQDAGRHPGGVLPPRGPS